MAVRFVIGRAGTGKTFHCVEAVRNGLREDPIHGAQLILLVPEQAALQMERAILEPDDIPAAHRAAALSFRRLAFKVLETAGSPVRTAISEPARAMVLRYLLHRHAGDLHYYRRAARFGGFIDGLSAVIAELIQEGVTPDSMDHVISPGAARSSQAAKLHDVQLIYAAYLDYLGEDRADPTQTLEIARKHLDRCAWLRGARLWVDGFASLSGLETDVLVELARICHSVDITLMMNPDDAGDGQLDALLDRSRMFRRSARTFHDLARHMSDAGITVDPPLYLDPPTPPRFARRPSLAVLEKSLFATDGFAGKATKPDSSIEIAELPTRRLEVQYAVAKVCEWTQRVESPLRYRDIAIIVRDLEPYHDLVSATLDAVGIPFFIDRRRPIAHHPLVELLRIVVAMAADDLSLESVRLGLKTGLLPIDTNDADELENYLLAHSISGSKQWMSTDWTMRTQARLLGDKGEPAPAEQKALNRINTSRKAFLDGTRAWLQLAQATTTTNGPEWAEAIRDLLSHLGIAASLDRWANEAALDGDVDQAEEHRQVYTDVLEFLDDLSVSFTDLSLSVVELGRVLEAGLDGLTLGLAPPMVDQVLVGSIERSRHPDIKAAVILGFNDGVFPKPLGEDAILNDEDRQCLIDAGVRVGVPSTDRVLEEGVFAYIALTRACENCVITYAAADNDGKALRCSPFLSEVRRILPDLELTQPADPCRTRETWEILTPRDLATRIAMEFRNRPSIQQDDVPRRVLWNGLYAGARADRTRDAEFRSAFSGLEPGRSIRLTSDSVERLHRGPLHTSVSQLETFAACPFQHFAKHILRLRERANGSLEAVDVGALHHAVLEDVITTLADGRRALGDASEDELLDSLDTSCRRVAAGLPASGLTSDARHAYVLRRTASQLARVLGHQRRIAQAGRARVSGAEIPFGFDKENSLPALPVTTPNGRHVQLRGFIDRVDLAELGDELLGIVIDYKRTRDKHLNMANVFHGLSLQLVAYLLALAECGETLAGRPIRPLAALYVSLASRYRVVDHPGDSGSAREEQLEGTFRPRGIIEAEGFAALDPHVSGGWSDSYSVYIKKDGTLGNVNAGDGVDRDTMQSVMAHTRWKLGQLADGILDGCVEVRPYRLGTLSPCSWCPMTSVCRFEMGLCDVRFYASLSRSDVFDAIAAGRDSAT